MPAQDTLTIDGINVRIRRHARARRLTLRIGANGPVLTIPARATLRAANAFLTRQSTWLRDRTASLPAPVPMDLGVTFPFAGQRLTVTRAQQGPTRVDGDLLLLAPSPKPPATQLRSFLIAEARRDLTAAARDYASQLGTPFGRITLRDTRSRWGSCTARGDLNFSWRLILAPAEVLDYVAAHEVAHLVEMNHSPAYWAVVADICPDFAVYRDWLRQNGPELHRYRFSP